MSLSSASAGTQAVITENKTSCKRLRELGFIEGNQLKVCATGSHLIVEILGSKIAVRADQVHGVIVKMI